MKNKQIFTFKNLQPVNVLHSCLNWDYQNCCKSILCRSMNQQLHNFVRVCHICSSTLTEFPPNSMCITNYYFFYQKILKNACHNFLAQGSVYKLFVSLTLQKPKRYSVYYDQQRKPANIHIEKLEPLTDRLID